MCYRTGKYTVCRARPCIIQPGNFTGWGSEGVKICGVYSLPGVTVTAHTCQFSAPGWHYLRHGYGVGLLDKGGSIVSLVSPDASQLTVVIETMVSVESLVSPDASQLTVVIETMVSVESLVSPDASQLTVVIETMVSVESLVSPDASQLTVVIETMVSIKSHIMS